jgi:tetratricopeptide (TPR) repeat protein
MVDNRSARRALTRTIGPFSLLLALLGLTGCDTVRARFVARDGVDLYHQGNYPAAAAKFEEAAKLDGRMPTFYLNLGTANLAAFRNAGARTPEGQKAADGAIKAFEQYLSLKPKDERVEGSLVQTFIDTGKYEEAVTHFRADVEKTPPDALALTKLAAIAAKCGKIDEARSWHEKRAAAEPTNPEPLLAVGVLLWGELHAHPDMPRERRKDLVDAALGSLRKAIELQPAAPNAYTYVNLVFREAANDAENDDGKRVALEEANKYYQMAQERQKHGN